MRRLSVLVSLFSVVAIGVGACVLVPRLAGPDAGRPADTVLSSAAVAPGAGPESPARAAALPSKKQWLADVSKVMYGSRTYLAERLARKKPGERLAINLDIDNTSLATQYTAGAAVPQVLRFATYAHRHGIKVFFNTARGPAKAGEAPPELRRAGYVVDRLCHRNPGEGLEQGKKRCRREFVASGFTIVANVGNRSTDFAGANYERAFKLPNYRNQLG